MFELPEVLTLARQVDETLVGKTIREGHLGNSPHKFVWYNRTPEEFAALVRDRTVAPTRVYGRWMTVGLEPGYVLLLGECGGRVLWHATGATLPARYHLLLSFTDGSHFSVTTQMWGAMELFGAGKERDRQYLMDMRPTPVASSFTREYFHDLLRLAAREKRSAKSLLTQDQLIPGLGNAIAQDILFRAGIHPRRRIAEVGEDARRRLFDAILSTVEQVIRAGGRNDEVDLFGKPGGYRRIMDKNAAGEPCPACGTRVEKIQYLGGACYVCPSCQA